MATASTSGDVLGERHAGLAGRVDLGSAGVWLLIIICALIVVPPVIYLLVSSFTVPVRGGPAEVGVANYLRTLSLGGWELWQTTLIFAAGSSVLSILLGFSTAWLVARTDVPCRGLVFAGAYLSLAAPLMVKGIGWILLLGPNNGLINNWLRTLTGSSEAPIELFSLGGMILVEGLLWAPIAFLLLLPALSAMDPALEEAAASAGATRWQSLTRVTLPLAGPSVFAVLLLSFIRALEAFDVPLLIGIPGRVQTVTTSLYQSMHTGFSPRYGEASAFAVLLILVVAIPLVLYWRATQAAGRFATVTGKGYRPSRIELGVWRWPCAAWVLVTPLSLVAPLLILLWASLLPRYQGPSLGDLGLMTLSNFTAVWVRTDTVRGMLNSLIVGVASATLVAALTLVMSWAVARRPERARFAIDGLASLPLVFPGIVLGLAVLVQFLWLRAIPIYGTVWILVVAFLIKYLPYGMRFIHGSILAINRDLEDNARTCGASPLAVMRAIVLPLAMPAVAAVWIYVFMHAIRDLSVAALLTGPNNAIVSMVILDLWNNGELPQLAALCITVAAFGAVLGLLFMRLAARHGQSD